MRLAFRFARSSEPRQHGRGVLRKLVVLSPRACRINQLSTVWAVTAAGLVVMDQLLARPEWWYGGSRLMQSGASALR
jgi:hypothetical protein